MRSPAVTSWHGTTGLGSCPDGRHRTGSTFDLSAIFDFQMKSKRQNHSGISDLSLGWSALENQTGRKNSAHETIWRLHGGPLRDSETPPPLLRRVAAEVFRLASISRPLMRPRRGVGVLRRASFLGAGASIRSTATTTSSFQGHRLPSRRALSARIASGLRRTHGAGGAGWPLALPASPGGACNGSEAAACPGLRSPEAFAAAPPHCAACRRPNRT